MAELFEEVVTLLESRSCTRALAGQFRIESEQAASNGAVLGVPIFLSRLGEWANDSAKSATVLDTLRSIETVGLQDPGAAVDGRLYDPVGSELTTTLLGDTRQKVVSVISGEAGISERSANSLLAPTAWAVVASIADRYGSRVDRQSLISILKKEEADLIESGWGPWLDATRSESAHESAKVASRQALPAAEGSAGGPDATGNYPPPVSRSARQVSDEPALPRPRSQLSNGRQTAGTVGHRRSQSNAGSNPERVREESDRSRLPALLGILALFLLGAAAIYLLFRGGDDSGGTGVDTEASVDDTTADGEAAPVLSEPLAIDVVMDDPQGRSESTGVAELRFQPETGEICHNVTAELIGSPYDGHIHVGPAGVKGGIVVDFGALNNGDIGCTTVSVTELAVILNDLSGHYVEMHDPSGDFTIRAQLSEAMPEETPEETPAEDRLFDPNSGGASTVIESGRVILRGDVADQATLDRLVAEFADVDGGGLELVNELNIVEGAPIPSGLITIDDAVLFDVNSDQLSGGSTAVADMAMLLKARPNWLVTVVGHTDSTGADVYNLELSLRRANAVKDELVAHGVASESLTTRGSGSTDPVGDNETPEGRASNRRIEFIVDRGLADG